jgi:hypothetical protein
MPAVSETKWVTMATWDDAPHLDDKTKKELWNSMPPYQRDARSKGVPQLGAGAIYPIAEEDILIDSFEIPIWWVRCYGLDVGWNHTAALWAAYDRDTDTVYLTDEYYRSQAEPAVHAASILMRGSWIPGVIDPASNTPNQKDGERLLYEYRELLGGNIFPASRGGGSPREAGILAVWKRFTTGRLKVFRHLTRFLSEFRIYRRDEKDQVVKMQDHLMDCMRYIITSGLHIATHAPDDDEKMAEFIKDHKQQNAGRSKVGGY